MATPVKIEKVVRVGGLGSFQGELKRSSRS